MEFKEEDIPVLDTILERMADEAPECCVLHDFKNIFGIDELSDDNFKDAERRLKYYGAIINHHGVGRIDTSGYYYAIYENINTTNCIKNGGFRTIYDNIKQREKDEKLTRELTTHQIEEIKRSKRIATISLWIAVISILLTVLGFFI